MESNESMFVDQLPFIVTIMTLAINLLRLALSKDRFRGFLDYAVEPFLTNLVPGTRLLVPRRQVGGARGGETLTLFFFCLVVFSVACSVAGQIFFKHAMSDQPMSSRTRRRLDLAREIRLETFLLGKRNVFNSDRVDDQPQHMRISST